MILNLLVLYHICSNRTSVLFWNLFTNPTQEYSHYDIMPLDIIPLSKRGIKVKYEMKSRKFRSLQRLMAGAGIWMSLWLFWGLYPRAESVKPVAQVTFEREYTQEGDATLERALITGLTEDRTVVWSVETEGYPAAQLTQCNEFGLYGDAYFYMEGGSLIKLNLSDGSIVWRCQCQGSPSSEAILFGEDGCIYYSGYYGPAFAAIDENGNLIKMLDEMDIPYYWPYKLAFTAEGEISIFFEGSDSGRGGVVNINPQTFEYYISQPGNSTEPLDPMLESLLKNIAAANSDASRLAAFCRIDLDGEGKDEVIVRTYTSEATEGGRYIYNIYLCSVVTNQYTEAAEGEFYSYASEEFVRYNEAHRTLAVNWSYADEVNFVIYACENGELYVLDETQEDLSDLPMLHFQEIEF